MIVITGASGGIGLQVAKLYKTAGKTVVNISLNECEFADTNIVVDLRRGSEVESAAAAVLAIDEPLEALINCAGVFSQQPIGEITDDEVTRVMDINVKAAMLLVSRLIDRIRNDGSDIVNVASMTAYKGYLDQAVYGTSKWAMRGFSTNLQTELKDTPCRVVSFSPGGIKTKLFEKATGTDKTAEGAWMQPEDVALFIKQILDLPKVMEVSEVIINRKQAL